jgi:hypothetical protein
MARPRKHRANTDREAEPARDTVAEKGEIKSQFDVFRVHMLEGIQMVEDIIERRCNPVMLKNLVNVREALMGLEHRAKRNELPDAYLRILLNDARLDALIFLSRLKVAMLYEHQRLLAPTEKLRSEIETSIERFLNDESGSMVHAGLDIQQELTILKHDFETLARAEKLIRDQESEPWWTSSTDGEKKLNLPSKK